MLQNLIFIVTLIISFNGMTQNFNEDVEAKIITRHDNDLVIIAGTAFNKTEINQSLRYELSVIKNNLDNSNRSKNSQSGQITLRISSVYRLSCQPVLYPHPGCINDREPSRGDWCLSNKCR